MIVNDKKRLLSLGEDISWLCHELNDCRKCKIRFRCRHKYDVTFTGETPPKAKDVFRYILMIARHQMKTNGRRKA